jgi:hypothetical protein
MSTGTSRSPAGHSRRSLLLAGIGAWAAEKECFLYAFFRDPGSSGVYFALSEDGYRFEALNGDKPWIAPQHEKMLMRDPYLTRGPDGVYHLLWTWGWLRDTVSGQLRIGHASSSDLTKWSSQQAIPIFPDEPAARNAWAPEMLYDRRQKHWLIFWSTTLPGKFPETEGQVTSGHNHRIYAMTSGDFREFSSPRLFFDPGYPVIDATLLEEQDRVIMIFKDERDIPVRKNLRVAVARQLDGPYAEAGGPFSADWAEGPSILKIGGDYIVYYDHYRQPRHYGAYRSRDLKQWEDVTNRMNFPVSSKHGSVLRIPAQLGAKLRERRA